MGGFKKLQYGRKLSSVLAVIGGGYGYWESGVLGVI